MDNSGKSQNINMVRDVCDVIVSQLPIFYHLLDMLNVYQGEKLQSLSNRSQEHLVFLQQYLQQIDESARSLFNDFSVMGQALTKLEMEKPFMKPFLKDIFSKLQNSWRECFTIVPSRDVVLAIKAVTGFLSAVGKLNYFMNTSTENSCKPVETVPLQTSLTPIAEATPSFAEKLGTVLSGFVEPKVETPEKEQSGADTTKFLENYLREIFALLGLDQGQTAFSKSLEGGLQNLWKALSNPMNQLFQGQIRPKDNLDNTRWPQF